MDRIPDNILTGAQETAHGYVYGQVEGRYIMDDTVQYVLGAGQSIILPLDYDPDEVDMDDDLPTAELGEGTIVDIVDMDGDGSFYRIYGAQAPDGTEYDLSAT
jgi:hypothetical protein